jgi:hypothetical protein
MTPEEQRIAIAEALGLFRIKPLRRTTRKGNESLDGVVLWHCSEHMGGAATYDKVPDYLNDLNAMHEAEKIKFCGSELVKAEWEYRLREVLAEGRPTFEVAGFELAHATAAQRAEAFLKTLHLWKE